VTLLVEPIRASDPPDWRSVLTSQGIPPDANLPDRLRELMDAALKHYRGLAEPHGLTCELSLANFQEIYRGEGQNAHATPLEAIAPRADHLALFAVTLGEPVCRKIRELFQRNDFALATMLDAIASERADAAAAAAGGHFLSSLERDGLAGPSIRVLAYSPGYCGWHITGQRKLFEFLQPDRIGITLNASCLMQPLKSVSGVIVAGTPDTHAFDDDFDFCSSCATRQCRDRIGSITGGAPADHA
jgi:AcrR family transcriptional regulator